MALHVVLGLAILAAAPAALAQMYKCVDERGITQYTDKPCKGGKQVDIQGQQPIGGELKAPVENLPKDEADFKRRQAQRERAEAMDRSALRQRCDQARREQSLLSRGSMVFKQGADGQRVYMDDAQREQRLAQLQELWRGCP